MPETTQGAEQERPFTTSSRPDRLVVVTPWYPTPEHPYWGAFVRETTLALLEQFPDPLVVHVEARVPDAPEVATTRDVVDGLEVLRVPFVADPTTPRARVAELTREALAPYADELAAAQVVHVHVGMPTGWAVVDLVGERTRVVVSEHASYLNRLWADERTSAMYADTVRGAARFTTVGEDTAQAVRRRYPDVADRVHTVPNPVDVARFEPREETPHRLDRWLYVGNVLESKGVLRLVRAFAAWRERRPDATLTVAGGGADTARAVALADELGVTDAVRFLGRVDPAQIGAVYRDADVLVHLSVSETFGLTAVEALATGLPVVATATRGAQRNLDVAQDLWMAWLVEIGDQVDDVLAAVEGLEARHRSARPALVREDLALRFGPGTIAATLGRTLRGEPEPEIPSDAPVVVAIALHRAVVPGAARIVRDAARRGARAYLVTDGPHAVDVDDRVTVLDVSPARYRVVTHRLERWTVDGVPRVLLGAARPLARAVGREATVDALAERQQGASAWLKRNLGEKAVHAHVDPLVLAGYVERAWGDLLVDPVLVTWGDPRGIPLATRIARANPDALVVRTAHHDVVVDVLGGAQGARGTRDTD
ncbi:glycosyltransferase [Cellulomonas palmilytica]|uniref:glycosyltransferase n=1 Tax=Cellulomonas palmilytica TaxID=2608402 RepID=UPI001F28044C|nr:glycosyltransferase [Cellulomonas palmilytica]UJP39535.1 glycosyltransferase [Cellulomonas palmilytica]